MQPIGIYVHVPFCDGKCPYCDFYSVSPNEQLLDDYTAALCRSVRLWGERAHARTADTVYFGGGTPVLLGAKRLNAVLHEIRSSFLVSDDAEITVEANPTGAREALFKALRAGGFNRLSMGLQSANDHELRFLGRKHTAYQAAEAFHAARRAGFSNISLDLILGLKDQTAQQIHRSVEFCAQLGAEHVSAYLLKIENGTPFAKRDISAELPNDDTQAELYLTACEALQAHGYIQYEISNFARKGFEGRHNLHYWHDEEYAAIGASAHGFLNGRRFYYPRNIQAFLHADTPTEDGSGGDRAEYLMLVLRLTEGICFEAYKAKFCESLPDRFFKKADQLSKGGLLVLDDTHVALTPKGFLVSNAVIAALLEAAFA